MARNSPMQVYQGLRNQLLTGDPATFGMKPAAPLDRVWGALTDIGVEGGNATILSLADGTTSMYTSTGGGIIGAGMHEAAAAASRAYLLELQDQLDLFAPADSCPLPPAGSVAFVVLTFEGIRRAEAAGVIDRDNPLFRANVAANRVITQLRLLQGSPPGNRTNE